MAGRFQWAGVAFLLSGIAIAADAVARGNASAYLVVIVPVVAGGSLEFVLAVGLIVVGLGLLVSGSGTWQREIDPAPWTTSEGSSGGVILLGPVPILFGSWARSTARRRWVWSLVGVGFLVAMVVAYFFVVGGW